MSNSNPAMTPLSLMQEATVLMPLFAPFTPGPGRATGWPPTCQESAKLVVFVTRIEPAISPLPLMADWATPESKPINVTWANGPAPPAPPKCCGEPSPEPAHPAQTEPATPTAIKSRFFICPPVALHAGKAHASLTAAESYDRKR